jgi:hypothetical protein
MARLTLALAIAASLAIAAPGAQAAGECRVPDGAHVEARNAHAVVYTTSRKARYATRIGLHACVGGDGRDALIDGTRSQDPNSNRFAPVVLNGYALAYAHVGDQDYGTASTFVSIVDLRHPELRYGASGASGYYAVPSVPRLVVTADGAAAYTVEWTSYHGVTHREVRVRDRDGVGTVDSGTGVALRSLERDGRTIAWTHSGERRTAHLAGMRRAGRCRLGPGADVRAHDGHTLVYSALRPDGTDFFACDRRTGEQVRFISGNADYEIDDDFSVNGRYVAYTYETFDHYGGQEIDLSVHDLAGRDHKPDAWVGGHAGDTTDDEAVADLAVSRHGDAAWTLRTCEYGGIRCGPERHEVAARDQFGYVRLAYARHVELDSLSVSDGRVSWKRAGRRHSARLWPSDRRVPCSLPRGGELRYRTREAIVYERRDGSNRHRVGHLFGCALASGLRTHLADEDAPRLHVPVVVLLGHVAALATEETRPDGSKVAQVRSVDLRRGLEVWSDLAGVAPPGSDVSVFDLDVAPNGAFVYEVDDADGARIRARWPHGGGTLDDDPSGSPWVVGYEARWFHGREIRTQDLH